MNQIALVTEWNGKYGGAENVNIEICKLFSTYPKVFAIWNDNEKIISEHKSVLRFCRNLPKQVTGFLSVFFNIFKLSKKYDFVISSSFMYAHLKRSRNIDAKHLVYVHTPIRYIWSPNIDDRASKFTVLFRFVSQILKKIELHYLDRSATFLCNSQEVAERILKNWGIRASVVYPPVDINYFSKFRQVDRPSTFRLISAGRFVKYKNHDKAIELARILNCKLILAGAGPEEKRLKSLAKEKNVNVDFVINPGRAELASLIALSSVFLHLAHEDFGILPIEAMSIGTPVVGFKVGGLLETVNSTNGRLSEDFAGLTDAIFEAKMLDRLKVSHSVEQYSTEEFRRKMYEIILSKWPELASSLTTYGK